MPSDPGDLLIFKSSVKSKYLGMPTSNQPLSSDLSAIKDVYLMGASREQNKANNLLSFSAVALLSPIAPYF